MNIKRSLYLGQDRYVVSSVRIRALTAADDAGVEHCRGIQGELGKGGRGRRNNGNMGVCNWSCVMEERIVLRYWKIFDSSRDGIYMYDMFVVEKAELITVIRTRTMSRFESRTRQAR